MEETKERMEKLGQDLMDMGLSQQEATNMIWATWATLADMVGNKKAADHFQSKIK